MEPLTALNWFERLAYWLLVRSRRVSMIALKTPEMNDVAWAVNRDDHMAVALIQNMFCLEEFEPASLMLERLYHSPSYGEDE